MSRFIKTHVGDWINIDHIAVLWAHETEDPDNADEVIGEVVATLSLSKALTGGPILMPILTTCCIESAYASLEKLNLQIRNGTEYAPFEAHCPRAIRQEAAQKQEEFPGGN